MLDPHVRISLLPTLETPGEYSVTFRAPDRHGVFKFVIDHRRKGCVLLSSSPRFTPILTSNAPLDGQLFRVLPRFQLFRHGTMVTRGS